MLYLEDYLEMIEHLPQQLRGRFNEMRDMDYSIQHAMEDLDKRVKQFFNECKRYPPSELPDSIEQEYQQIRQEYHKSLEEADEKVQLANQMYDLVDKFLRQLDTELHKFKCELEADNKGITEVLEKRSLELDNQVVVPTPAVASQQKENRFENSSSSTFRYSSRPPRNEKRRETSTLQAPFAEKRQALGPSPLMESRHIPSAVAPSQVTPAAPTQTQNVTSYNLHIGAGPAIAAAASQAIAATQQMQQGRRTASLKASYEAINPGGHGHEFSIGRELAGAAQTAIQAIQQDNAINKKKQKKWSSSTSATASSSSSSAVQAILNSQPVVQAPESPSVDLAAQNADATDGEWTYDPNEPRYCLCNQVSYGDMVACDNEDCPSEWFHYPCVGITAPPKGKWFCPQCTQSMKRRGGRK